MTAKEIYSSIIQQSKKEVAEIGYFRDTDSLSVGGGKIPPASIAQSEFTFIKSMIIANKLKRGIEIATGFGISSLAAGLGFQTTGGEIVTIDSYIEQHYKNSHSYFGKKEIYEYSTGYVTAQWIHKLFGVDKNVFLQVGWSPDDVGKCIERVFGGEIKFDYVFSDGAHNNEQVVQDFEAIRPFLADKNFLYLIHDLATPEPSIRYISKELGIEPMFLSGKPKGNQIFWPDTWGMAIFTDLELGI